MPVWIAGLSRRVSRCVAAWEGSGHARFVLVGRGSSFGCAEAVAGAGGGGGAGGAGVAVDVLRRDQWHGRQPGYGEKAVQDDPAWGGCGGRGRRCTGTCRGVPRDGPGEALRYG